MNTLFDILPLARNSDPVSSFEAAEELVESGRLGKQEQEVLTSLELYPGSSSKELAEKSGMDRYAVARRLRRLEYTGRARNCPRDCFKACKINGQLCDFAQEYIPLRWWAR